MVQAEVVQSSPDDVIEMFNARDPFSRTAPGVYAACNRNKYQKTFLGLKRGGA
jgi:hypothetical protein